MLKAIVAFVSFLSVAKCEFVVLERRDDPPAGFSNIGAPPPNQILPLRLSLTQSNTAGLEDTVYEVSTPGNSRYGQYLTQDEVNRFVAPPKDTLSQVNSWLTSNNLTSSPLTPAGDWILVNMTVSQANQLLIADFSTFQNQKTNQTVVRTLSYSVPDTLKTSINWIYPTVTFPFARGIGAPPSYVNKTSDAVSARAAATSISPDCQVDWTPACIQQLYGIPSTKAKDAANVLGISGFGNDFANKRDLKVFLETYRPDIDPNTTFDLISIDGGINNQLPFGAGLEADPDMQYAVGLATGVPVTFISTGTIVNDALTEFLDQAHYLISLERPPQTILNNFGGLESQVSPQIAISLCNAYAQLAARGVSYIVQTDIWGAGGSIFDPDCKPFTPPFPATCPFVTAVGATEFNTDETEETASQNSGGGFSNFFKRPRYQDGVVSAYLTATGNAETTAFNISGRAVPDVSALWLLPFILDGSVIDFLASPSFGAGIFASTVALLTNERIAAGKPGLGFLNPLLYQNPSAFTDMKTGNNPGCNTDGFNATTGWDPVTGFGSPIYPKLQDICSKL
ncbi:family S53 protease [Mycena crocata]|nr:family S53 protease [Mycena crocata]